MARLLAVAALVAAAVVCAAAGPAQADKIDDQRAQIAQAEAQLAALDAKLEGAIERYNRARGELDVVRAKIEENTRRLKIARRNLEIAKRNLAGFLVSTYKQGQGDAAFYVLGSGSLSDLVDRIDTVERMAEIEGDLVAQVRAAEREIADRQARLREAEQQAEKLLREARSYKAEVQQALHQRQAMLGGMRDELRHLIDQRQARLDRIARKRAAQLAQQQEQADDTTGGGSGDSGGGDPAPAPSTLGAQAVAIAQQYLGVPYVWGGASPSGFDCSGLTMYVYAQLGISLGHYTGTQWNQGAHVSMSELAPGDLVFFYSDLHHMGLYMGGGLFIHAPHTGDVVKISSLSGYYAANFMGGVRVTG